MVLGEFLPPGVGNLGEFLPPVEPRFALIVGVSHFGDGFAPLPGAGRDAASLFNRLSSGRYGYDSANVDIRKDPTREQYREAIGLLCERSRRHTNPTVLLFLATHGLYIGEDYHLCTRDSCLVDGAPNQTIPFAELREWLKPLGESPLVFILDSCRAVLDGEGEAGKAPGSLSLYGNNWAIWTSASHGQKSWEEPPVLAPGEQQDGPHGLFTRQLLLELNEPAAHDEEQEISLGAFYNKVRIRVEHAVRLSRQGVEQKPNLISNYQVEPVVGVRFNNVWNQGHLVEPFRPLRPYTELDRNHFFGREEFLERMVGQGNSKGKVGWLLGVEKHHVLHAPSGAGKSSLLRAGVLPRLQDCGHKVFYVDCRVFDALSKQVSLYLGNASPQHLDEMIEACLEGLLGQSYVVFLFDQFESMLLEAGQQQHLQWLYLELERLAARPELKRYRLLLSFRADCMNLLTEPLFSGEKKQSFVQLLNIGANQWHGLSYLTVKATRRVLYNALKGSPIQFSADLLEELVRDLYQEQHEHRGGGGEIYPPSLQLVSQELCRRGTGPDNNVVTLRVYEDAGRLEGILNQLLSRSVEGEVEGLPQSLQDCGWEILQALTTNDGKRNPLSESSLVQRMERKGRNEKEVRQVLDSLRERRLLIVYFRGGENLWDLSHEFLGRLLIKRLQEQPSYREFQRAYLAVKELRKELRQGRKPLSFSLQRAQEIQKYLDELCHQELEELETSLLLKDEHQKHKEVEKLAKENKRVRSFVDENIQSHTTPIRLTLFVVIPFLLLVIFVVYHSSYPNQNDDKSSFEQVLLQGKGSEQVEQKDAGTKAKVRHPDEQVAEQHFKTKVEESVVTNPDLFASELRSDIKSQSQDSKEESRALMYVEAGDEHYRSEEFGKAAYFYKKACSRQKRHCYKLGYLLLHRREGFLKKNWSPSREKLNNNYVLKLFDQACEHKSGSGCYYLGYWQKAMKLSRNSYKTSFQKGCQLRNGLACYELGALALDKKSMQNIKLAIKSFEKSCQYSVKKGCATLGRAYCHLGKYKKAYRLYKKTCQNKRDDACVDLARLLLIGRGVTLDAEKAVGLLQNSCKSKNDRGCYILGSHYEQKKQCLKAQESYQKACSLNSFQVCPGIERGTFLSECQKK
ncbi:MAG: hypothetical protein EP343_00610 [Deltaproteobacteria bacterium]|nr:MAG: hypothetical protein EP343_00610 [Deltaproteobacteria bacterium]